MHYFMIALCSMTLFQQALYADSLIKQIDSTVKKELPHATISILVKDAKNGQIIFSKNANKLLYPASTIKLFTATAALYHWQPEHYFETDLLKDNQNYYIRFGASPSLTSENLGTLISDYFTQKHITQIKGSIVLDTSIFKPPYYPGGISYDDLGWYYAAPDPAIILDENKASFKMTAGELGKLTSLTTVNHENRLTVINHVITVSDEQSPACGLNVFLKNNNEVELYGCMAHTKNAKLLELAIPNPGYSAQQLIQKILKQKKIKFTGNILFNKTPASAIQVASLQSHPLNKLIIHMLKESDNLYADNIAKQLAYALTKEGTNKQSVFAIKQILAKHIPLNYDQLELADGIGTRYNLITTEQVSILLRAIYHDKKLFPLFIQALPQSGVSGTLKDRMKNTKLEKIVYAKTGTMHDISALSGFIINPHGRTFIFSIIINGINQPLSKAKALEEQILSLINEEYSSDLPEHSQFA